MTVPCLQRKAAWIHANSPPPFAKQLNRSPKGQAQMVWAAKRDQVQIAQAHLSCCVKDHEGLLLQQAMLARQIAAYGEKCQEVRHARCLCSSHETWHTARHLQ